MIARASPVDLALMLAGFAIWGLALNVLYGGLSVGCELGWQRAALGPVSLQRAVLLGLWAALLVAHVGLIAWLRRRFATPAPPRLDRFVQFVCVANAWIGLAATIVTGGLVAFLTPCAP